MNIQHPIDGEPKSRKPFTGEWARKQWTQWCWGFAWGAVLTAIVLVLCGCSCVKRFEPGVQLVVDLGPRLAHDGAHR